MANERSVLDVIFNFLKKGDAPKEVNKDLEKLNKTQATLGKSSKGLELAQIGVQGAMLAVGIAALKSVPALIDQGLAINRAESALEAYAGGSQAAADAIDAVNVASGHALNSFVATENATRLFALGLATNAEEAGKLTEAAITLGAAVGTDATTAFNDFSLMLANQSLPRLDTFGISSGVVRKRIIELMDATEGMTRAQAFQIATMEEAEKKLKELDAAGFQATSSVDRLKAAIDNAKLATAEWLADGLVPLIDATFELNDGMTNQRDELVASADSFEEYKKSIWAIQNPTSKAAALITELTKEQFEQAKMTALVDEEWKKYLATQDDVQGATEDTATSLDDLVVSEELAKEQLTELAMAMKFDFTDAFETAQERIGDAKTELMGFQERAAELEAIQYKTPEQQEELNGLQEDIEDATDKVGELQAAWDEQTKQMVFGIIEQKLAIDGFTQEEIDALTRLAGPDGFGLIDQAGQDLILRIDEVSSNFVEGSPEWLAALTTGVIDPLNEAANTAGTTREAIDKITSTQTVSIHFQTTGATSFANSDLFEGGFQHGGEFVTGGLPGPDRNLTTIATSPGERVTVTPREGIAPSDRGGGGGRGGGGNTFNVYNDFDATLMAQFLRNQ